MTCRTARKSLPLLAGDDLGPQKSAKVRSHLDACAACRREARAYGGVRSAARALARAEAPPAWSEAAWRAAVRSASAAAPAPKRGLAPALRPVLVASLAAAVVLGGAAVALKTLRSHPRPDAPLAAIFDAGPGPVLRGPVGPHLTTIMIDPKDGRIRLVWRFNRDFVPEFYGK